MLNPPLRASVITLGLIGPAMAQERVLISSDWGRVTAELVDNNATRALVRMLPLTIEMRDHLRQEKTGNLPSPLPTVERQLDFATGTLGLWNSDHFVIYYRDGRVPQPGIIPLGRVTGDVSIFDRPGQVTVRSNASNRRAPLSTTRSVEAQRWSRICHAADAVLARSCAGPRRRMFATAAVAPKQVKVLRKKDQLHEPLSS